MSEYQLTLTMVIQILQISIAPVVLISGVGLIILSQTNRMAHLTNRIRQMRAEAKRGDALKLQQQIGLLYRRAKINRLSIISLLLCIFFDALVIFDIFISKIFAIENGLVTTILFTVSLIFLIFGLIAFIVDVNYNLIALKIEIES